MTARRNEDYRAAKRNRAKAEKLNWRGLRRIHIRHKDRVTDGISPTGEKIRIVTPCIQTRVTMPPKAA